MHVYMTSHARLRSIHLGILIMHVYTLCQNTPQYLLHLISNFLCLISLRKEDLDDDAIELYCKGTNVSRNTYGCVNYVYTYIHIYIAVLN